MTRVPGTYFTKEKLEDALRADNVSGGGLSGIERMFRIGCVYHNEKKKYDKALAWFILAAKGNHAEAQTYIGYYYYNGLSVPKNYLCALKWYLKSSKRREHHSTFNTIGALLENGYGVPCDKYKALEWYCHGENKIYKDRLKGEGYHRSALDKKKPLGNLRKETEAILDAEKRRLELQQSQTHKKLEILEQLKITYKLVDGGSSAWDNVPILLSRDKRHSAKSTNNRVATNNKDEIHELKKQIRLLKQDKSTFRDKGEQLEQDVKNLNLLINDMDEELKSLRQDKKSLQQGNYNVQHQIRRSDSKMSSLKSENSELKSKIDNLEQQVNEKDSEISSILNENQSLRQEKAKNEYQLNNMVNTINSIKNDNHRYRTLSLEQDRKLETLNYEIQLLKASNNSLMQSKQEADSKIERLTTTNTRLEQLIKSAEDATIASNEDNEKLSASNQHFRAKINELELLGQDMKLQLVDGKRKRNALKQENQLLKQRVQDHETRRLSPVIVEPIHDDGNSRNDTTFAAKLDCSEGSDDGDINYDTPDEDEE